MSECMYICMYVCKYDCFVLPGASPARHAAATRRYSSVSKSLLLRAWAISAGRPDPGFWNSRPKIPPPIPDVCMYVCMF